MLITTVPASRSISDKQARDVERAMDAYTRRTGTAAADYLPSAMPTPSSPVLASTSRAGVSKFVLRPLGADGADVMGQTRRLIAEVLPEVAARWPRPSKEAVKPAKG